MKSSVKYKTFALTSEFAGDPSWWTLEGYKAVRMKLIGDKVWVEFEADA